MKILHVGSLYPPTFGGGAELSMSSLASGLASRGSDISVLVTHQGSAIVTEQMAGVTVIRVPLRNIYWHSDRYSRSRWLHGIWHAVDSYNPLMSDVVARIVLERQPDVIVCHNLVGFSCAVWGVAEKFDIPVVQVLHDYYSLCPKSTMFNRGVNCSKQCVSCSLLRLPHRSASRSVAAVVGVSNWVLDAHIKLGLFENASVRRVIYNAQSFPDSSLRPVRSSVEAITFGYIGALTEVKGINLLLEVFRSFSEISSRKVRLLVAGNGDESYVSRLRSRYASENVEFVGQFSAPEFFRMLDVSVVPSLWNEPLGRVVFESMHFGVPVIGANRGGIPEMISHESNGLIFEPSNPASLFDAMSRVVEDAPLLKAMQFAASNSVATFADEQRVLDEYESVFLNVSETKPHAIAS